MEVAENKEDPNQDKNLNKCPDPNHVLLKKMSKGKVNTN